MPARFAKVDQHLFRGGEPSDEDLKMLKDVCGVKKIISLDGDIGAAIDDKCKELNLEHIVIPLTDGNGQNVDKMPSEVQQWTSGGPAYVHCKHGKDRTGMACAMYRVFVNGWNADAALKEANAFGMGHGLANGQSYYDAVIRYTDSNYVSDIVTQQRDGLEWSQPRPGYGEFNPISTPFSDSENMLGRQQSFAPYTDGDNAHLNLISFRINELLKFADFESYLRSLGLSEDVIQFIVSQPDEYKDAYVRKARKNPGITVQELGAVEITQPMDPVEIATQRYPNMQREIQQLVSADPAGNNKYLLWGLQQLANGHNMADLIPTIQFFHNNIQKFPKKNIEQYDDLKEVEDIVKDISLQTSSRQQKQEEKGQAEKLYEDDQYVLIRPDSKDACVYYGRDTKWCITMKNESFYERYAGSNVIFYFLINRNKSRDALSKIAFAIQRGVDNSIVNIDIFNAHDQEIMDKDVSEAVPNYDNLKAMMKADAINIPKGILVRMTLGEASDEEVDEYLSLFDEKDLYNILISDLRNSRYNEVYEKYFYKLINNDSTKAAQIAKNYATLSKVLDYLADNFINDKDVISNVIRNINTESYTLEKIYKNVNSEFKLNDLLVLNKNTPNYIHTEIFNKQLSSMQSPRVGPLEQQRLSYSIEKLPVNILQKIIDEIKDNNVLFNNEFVREAFVKNPNATSEMLRTIFEQVSSKNDTELPTTVCHMLARHHNTPSDILQKLYTQNNAYSDDIASNPSISDDLIEEILDSFLNSKFSLTHDKVLRAIAKNPAVKGDNLMRLYNKYKTGKLGAAAIASGLIQNPNTPKEFFYEFVKNDNLIDDLGYSPYTPVDLLQELADGKFGADIYTAQDARETLRKLQTQAFRINELLKFAKHGTYKGKPCSADSVKKKITFQGLDIHIDRPKDFVMSGKDQNGNDWERVYKYDYGFIPKTLGGDKEGIDVFIGPNKDAKDAFWAIQKKFSGGFDEYKVFLGFKNKASAEKAYKEHIPAQLFGGMMSTTVEMMKAMLGINPKTAGMQIRMQQTYSLIAKAQPIYIFRYGKKSDLLLPNHLWATNAKDAKAISQETDHDAQVFFARIPDSARIAEFAHEPVHPFVQMAELAGSDAVLFRPPNAPTQYFIINPAILIDIGMLNEDSNDVPMVGMRDNYDGLAQFSFPGSGGILPYGGFGGVTQLPSGNL